MKKLLTHNGNVDTNDANPESETGRNYSNEGYHFTESHVQTTKGHRTALIYTGAWHSLISQSTLDKLSEKNGVNRHEKTPPMQNNHRLGNDGQRFQAEFSIRIPFTAVNDR